MGTAGIQDTRGDSTEVIRAYLGDPREQQRFGDLQGLHGFGGCMGLPGYGGLLGTALVWGHPGTDGCGGDSMGARIWGTHGDSADLVTEVVRACLGNLWGQQRFGDPQGQPQYCGPIDESRLWGTPHPGGTHRIPMLRSLCRSWGSFLVCPRSHPKPPPAREPHGYAVPHRDGEWGTKAPKWRVGEGLQLPPSLPPRPPFPSADFPAGKMEK